MKPSLRKQNHGQAYAEFIAFMVAGLVFIWAILGLGSFIDLHHSTQQARRFLAWEGGTGNPAPDAARVEALFFEHPLYGYGYNPLTPPAPLPNISWEGTPNADGSNQIASLSFDNNAITLIDNQQQINATAVVDGNNNPVFLGSVFANPAAYQNQNINVNLAQAPYLMPDALAAVLSNDNTVAVPPATATASGGVFNDSLMPANEDAFTQGIDPVPGPLTLAATEIWSSANALFALIFGSVGFNVNIDLGIFNFNIAAGPGAYPFNEVAQQPADDFFDVVTPDQSIVLPADRLQ